MAVSDTKLIGLRVLTIFFNIKGTFTDTRVTPLTDYTVRGTSDRGTALCLGEGGWVGRGSRGRGWGLGLVLREGGEPGWG